MALHFSPERMEDFRHDAIEEMAREYEADRHEGEGHEAVWPDSADASCMVCVQRAEDEDEDA